jgi:uncharacterized membrane protein
MAEYVTGGRVVEAGRGWDWIAAGWGLFKKQAGMWIALALVLFVIFLVLAFIPIIGSAASFILSPVFAAGVLVCSREVDEGRSLEIGHLFAGFREKLGPLAAVGAIYLAAAVVIMLVVGLFVGASMFAVMMGRGEAPATPAAAFTPLLAILIVLALLLPVVMAVWFAPALVMFHNVGAVEAMKESFTGCLRNVVPFLVYGVVLMVFAVIASIPLGLGWLVLGPVLCTSYYASYKDIYPAA